MATFEITVTRKSDREGTLEYRGTIVHRARCWWNPDRRIPQGTYAECSATRMAKAKASDGVQKRHAVFLKGVSGYTGVFIHYGKNLTNLGSLKLWSQGCIVLEEPDVLKIWNDIAPKDGLNVTVNVRDAEGTYAGR